MNGCKHCGAEKNGTAWGEETYACGMTSGYPVDVRTTECLRRENAQISTDRDRLAAELQAKTAELEIARAELVHQRDGYDHEPSEHTHGGTCRACKSEAALEKMDAIRAALAAMEPKEKESPRG